MLHSCVRVSPPVWHGGVCVVVPTDGLGTENWGELERLGEGACHQDSSLEWGMRMERQARPMQMGQSDLDRAEQRSLPCWR